MNDHRRPARSTRALRVLLTRLCAISLAGCALLHIPTQLLDVATPQTEQLVTYFAVLAIVAGLPALYLLITTKE